MPLNKKTSVNVIQKAKNGRGAVYLIKNADPAVLAALTKHFNNHKPANDPRRNIYFNNSGRQGAGFHYNNIKFFSNLNLPNRPDATYARIIYNPNPTPIAGTVLVLNDPTTENRSFIETRTLYPPGKEKNLLLGRFKTNYKVKNSGDSSIKSRMLEPGEALYFEGESTLHGFPYRTQPVRIYRGDRRLTENNFKKTVSATSNANQQKRAKTSVRSHVGSNVHKKKRAKSSKS